MRSKILQAKAQEKRRLQLEKEQREEKLKEIVEMILLNRENFEIEFSRILDFLNSIEEVTLEYNEENQSMVYWHSKDLVEKISKIATFKSLANKVKEVSNEAFDELFGDINWFDFIEGLNNQDNKLKKVAYIWSAQAIIKNMKFQFERIWKAEDESKQIAIIKGALALY